MIGVTGGIGAGKSIICRILKVMGIPVYDADSRAKWLMNNDPNLREHIIEAFGEEAYADDSKLNRVYLAKTVFNDSERLSQLNNLVHPAVADDFINWSKEYGHFPYLIKEAALLFESGSYKQLDKVINVDAPENVRLKRVLLRDHHRTSADVKAIMSKQLGDKQRKKLATFTVINDDHQLVIPQVVALHNKIIASV